MLNARGRLWRQGNAQVLVLQLKRHLWHSKNLLEPLCIIMGIHYDYMMCIYTIQLNYDCVFKF